MPKVGKPGPAHGSKILSTQFSLALWVLILMMMFTCSQSFWHFLKAHIPNPVRQEDQRSLYLECISCLRNPLSVSHDHSQLHRYLEKWAFLSYSHSAALSKIMLVLVRKLEKLTSEKELTEPAVGVVGCSSTNKCWLAVHLRGRKQKSVDSSPEDLKKSKQVNVEFNNSS